VVKKTWAFGHQRTGDDIKIEEILERRTLQKAVLSAFCWDSDWLLSKLDFPRTKLIFVMQGKTEEERERLLAETEPARSSLDICFPNMQGAINCMHSKLMLLFYPDKLRVAVPSANLTPWDWGETGVLENSVFLIDLPRNLSSTPAVPRRNLPRFAQELLHFAEAKGLRSNVITGLMAHDWTATEGLAFVHTIGGPAYGASANRTGLLGLSNAVHFLNLSTSASLRLDFTASSIGTLNDEYLRLLHAAARGLLHPGREAGQVQNIPQVPIRDLMRIYYPTHETVAASTGGVDNGGTIFLSRKAYEGAKFPRAMLRDYHSVRRGMLSHNKILYGRGVKSDQGTDTKAESNGGMKGWVKQEGQSKTKKEAEKGIKEEVKAEKKRKAKKDDEEEAHDGVEDASTAKLETGTPAQPREDVAWVYVGSANMSESAWGKLSFDKQRKETKQTCRNWECGVLIPVKVPAQVNADGVGHNKEGTELNMDVFDGVVKVPFQLPARAYEGRQPWYVRKD